MKRAQFSPQANNARWVIPLLLLGALLGGIFALTRPSTATSTAALYVSPAKVEAGVDASQLTNTVLAKMYSYYNFTQSNTVLQPVIDKLKLDTTVNELRESVHASVPADAMVIEVSVEAKDPEQAALIANTVRDSLSNAITKMTPDQAGGSPAIEVFQYQDANQNTVVSKPSPVLFALLGGLCGALAGMIARSLAIRSAANRPDEAKVADPL